MIRTAITSLISGTLFGAGLALGGMTDPARVRGFLDIFGDWWCAEANDGTPRSITTRDWRDD